jgi:uncharacterized FlaG/YvyC family protein
MSDAVQLPPVLPVVPRVAPVRAAEHIDPPKKSQTENHNSSDQQSRDAQIQNAIADADKRLKISKDEASRGFVYRSIENETNKVVWQWPAEEILRRAQYLRELEENLRHEVDETA